ncbi:MAG: cobaltochelatase subunit CobN [Rhodospirillales bacterium]
MHLLAAQPGAINDGSEAIDLGQTPGDIVFLSAADTELALLADARAALSEYPELRLANLMHLGHNMSVDLYADAVIAKAKLVIVRLLGGRGYWTYGVDQISGVCREAGIPVAFLPGDDQPDAELAGMTTLAPDAAHRLWQYLVHGGAVNARSFLGFAAGLLDVDLDWREPEPLLRAGLYWPGETLDSLDALRRHWVDGQPVAALVFYRALVQAGNTRAVDALVYGLAAAGLNPLPVFAQSLKDPVVAALIADAFDAAKPDVIVNATGFAVSAPGAARSETPFDGADCPILQAVFSGGNLDGWRDGVAGLSARDIAMNVALPEVDGRIFSRAVSFKGRSRRDPLTETDIVAYEPVADRVAFVAELAGRWARLRRKPAAKRKIALVMANYPNKDGRLGNGVGLDTPAGAMNVLRAMADAGYRVEDLPADGNGLIAHMQSGPTNDFRQLGARTVRESIGLNEYQLFFAGLPAVVRDAVIERWGAPEQDPFYLPGEVDCGRFALSAFRLGNVIVGLQPARGYNIDPVESYHDPDLVPPHNYLAFYAWLRDVEDVDAVVHFGKHGNMEWLPGKSLALAETCFPEAVFGPTPHLYPFIVNDPGEGTQAKRRAQAVIVDHLTPPLTRAESYGPLRDLEQLVDEYYEAAGVDPRRLKVLKKEILSLCQATGVGADCGMAEDEGEDEALRKLDNYLCELKELQIRDGLHVFGDAPVGGLLTDLLVALLRVPRASGTKIGKNEGESILRALADDLGIGRPDFDPLDCEMAAPWTGDQPEALAALLDEPWRTAGDTVERLELLAKALVSDDQKADPAWTRTAAVLDGLADGLRPAVIASGAGEIAGLLTGLDGRFVAPGPSGAPTRGRPDVLPTGRNFYSVDTRTVPTPAAWTLGWKSASLLIETYRQDHGSWPRAMAISAWGTSNMRTGGDDIAQGLALMGVRPTWDTASRRVTGFEVLPADVLGRPRVDVTLRVSGFFRDAFPALIDLFDSASRAVAALDEPESINPAAANRRAEIDQLVADGVAPADAERRAGFRVFGSKPGAYGAGLQALIDERGWQDDGDLARAYVAWGGYAYGGGVGGESAHGAFEKRLRGAEAVIHNQDNREHDLLDSDDYYQFEGGMTAAVRVLSGAQPTVYHNDHSRPETPRIRTLDDEIGRIVRARVVNPKWIAGVMRHGYKGAFEMAATVDYLFAFAATARCVRDHHFDAVFDAYLNDDEVRAFLERNNPAALAEMAARLKEAQDRGLWRPRRNDTRDLLDGLAA